MAPPSSITPSLPPPSHLFTPIHEGNETEESEERHRFGSTTPSTLPSSSCTESIYHHNPTPLHQPGSKKPTRKHKPSPSNHHTVSCNNCRPTTREKTSVIVVPVDHHHHNSLSSTSSPSPNRLFKSLISGISRRTPKPTSDPSKTPPYTEEQWRITVAELSHKLSQATRRRDEAILEASRLKYSMSELENKLNRLELYCHNLQSGLEICNQAQAQAQTQSPVIVNSFLVAVSDARTSIRVLSKALSSQLKLMGVKVLERLSVVLKSYDFKIISSSSLTAPNNIQYYKSLQYYLEAVLSRVFYHDFESSGFGSSMDQILNPIDRCEANYSAYNGLKDLTWDQVLNKGTQHFSEEFSRFCDRKMSEIVGLLGWTRAWPEKLLEAFFGASKSVWLVHLLANSVHQRLMIFRVEKGARFDPVYMEDMGGGGGVVKAKKLIPTMVKIMVEPGFYVYDNVVKCKVISKYYNNINSNYGSVFSGNDDV